MSSYSLEGGKYEVRYDEGTGLITGVFRFGEDWRDVTGDKFIHALFWRVLELQRGMDEQHKEVYG